MPTAMVRPTELIQLCADLDDVEENICRHPGHALPTPKLACRAGRGRSLGAPPPPWAITTRFRGRADLAFAHSRISGNRGQRVSAVVWPWTPAFAGVGGDDWQLKKEKPPVPRRRLLEQWRASGRPRWPPFAFSLRSRSE
jgi:hypothetical protein